MPCRMVHKRRDDLGQSTLIRLYSEYFPTKGLKAHARISLVFAPLICISEVFIHNEDLSFISFYTFLYAISSPFFFL